MTPIQGKHLISSGNKATLAIVIRSLAGLLMEIMNFFFPVYVCHFFLPFFIFFYTLFTPTSSCDDFQKKKPHEFGILHLGIFWQRKVPVGLPFPWDRSVGAQPSSCSGGAAAGAEQGSKQLRAVPQVGTALGHLQCDTSTALACDTSGVTPAVCDTSVPLPVWGCHRSFSSNETWLWNYPVSTPWSWNESSECHWIKINTH